MLNDTQPTTSSSSEVQMNDNNNNTTTNNNNTTIENNKTNNNGKEEPERKKLKLSISKNEKQQIRKTFNISLCSDMNDNSQIYPIKEIKELNNISNNNNNIIQEGDLVIFYLNHDNMKADIIKKGETFECRFGIFSHDKIIGKTFGTILQNEKKGNANNKKNKNMMDSFIYVLQPTPQLWTLALKHRTQILYHADISLIVNHFHLKPGSIVIEAGTGSGSLSHSIAKSIMPNGQLFTFEYHFERFKQAIEEFKSNGLYNVTITNGDVCENGFNVNQSTTNISIHQNQLQPSISEPLQVLGEDKYETVDAVFLDLPKPWLCIKNVFRLLKFGGKFCGFSPCIEQIQNTADALREHDFVDITSVECLAREYMGSNVKMESVDKYFNNNDKMQIDNDNAVTSNIVFVDNTKESATVVSTNNNNNNTSTVEKKLYHAVPEMKGHTGYLIFATKYYLKSE
ncbi:hypothetical protein ABK040_000623 [Willaertia magna]